MTLHQNIAETERRAAWAEITDALGRAMDAAERMPDGSTAIGEALCAALDTVGAGAPRYEPFGNMRDEAAWWADMATPLEIETYAAAALQRAGRTTFAMRARKRLFMAMWDTFTPQERTAFLEKIGKQGG